MSETVPVDDLEVTQATEVRGGPGLPRMLAAVGLCVLPLVAVLASPWAAEGGLVYVGLLPAFVALTSGIRVTVATALATGVVMLVGLLLSGSPPAAAVLLGALGLGVAWSYTRGWQGPATYLATQAALATVAAPQSSLLDADRYDAGSLANAALVAGVATLAGLWVAGVGALLLADLVVAAHGRPWDRELAVFAATLAGLLTVLTYVIMLRSSNANAWWILLTVLVSVTPAVGASPARAAQRAGGTILGGGVAALLVALDPGSGVLAAVGLLGVLGSAVAYVRAPYWVFAAALTLALVLVTFPVDQVLRGDLERVVYTVLAAVLVSVVTVAVDRVTGRVTASA